ncbi:MAG: ATP-binding protein [Ignavibacteria bacterium]
MKKIISFHNYLPLIIAIESVSLMLLYGRIDTVSFSITSATFIIITIAHIYLHARSKTERTDFFGKYSKLLMSDEETHALNNYEAKISKVNNIVEEMNSSFDKLSANDEFKEIFNSFSLIINRLLDELNTAKIFKVNRNEFLGNVAHELRTPIFAIQLSLETLADGAINDTSVNKDFLEKAKRQSTRLKELVDDLIHISKLEEGMKLSKRYFSINQLIKDTINELSEITKRKSINLLFETEIKDVSVVFADAERIKQVLINLIDNSSKYTLENGNITISTKHVDKCVYVSVEDTGLGIPKEDLPRIFERFYRVDKTRSRDMGGSGLGLSIVKHILELHNSQVKVESEPGKGTKFEFNLPV